MNVREAKEIMKRYKPSIQSDWSKATAEGIPEYLAAKVFLEAIEKMKPLVNAAKNILEMGALDGVEDSRIDYFWKVLESYKHDVLGLGEKE